MMERLSYVEEIEEGKRRLEIIEKYDKYVEEVTRREYGAKRKVISRRKKRNM